MAEPTADVSEAPLEPPEGRTHFLTVAVEDYFHATALNPLVSRRHWERMESRVRENTDRTLEFLAAHDCKATFFVMGWVAERAPEIIRQIYDAGHEVASKGYERRMPSEHTDESFREDVRHSRNILEKALGRKILGYRVPQGHFGVDDVGALKILAEEGFIYDSSVYPRWRSIAGRPWMRFPYVHHEGGLEILECPMSSIGSGVYLPVAGGNYLRQLPHPLMHALFELWNRRYISPFNMYFHVWELDPDLPRIATAGALTRVRQYRNLEKMPEILSYYLARYRFTSIADFCRYMQEPLEGALDSEPRDEPAELLTADELADRTPITIVVPCFNEAKVIAYLDNALKEVRDTLGRKYEIEFVLVDDCSTDDTWARMNETFGDRPGFRLVHHEVNKGVAGAILTGIKAADTEIVCSMDADCTYDPRQLESLIPMLGDDVAMVTASPYHPDGRVVGVPEWRLFLSRNLSRIYGMVLHHKFKTYTSCFRAYRRSVVENLELSNGGFLGVAEMLILLDLQGHKLVECPATLETRLLGASKLKTFRTVRQHLNLLASIPKMKREIEQDAET